MDLDGAIIGQYHLVKQIGRGGMAAVYKAYQPNLDRYVAIKLLTPALAEEEGILARFEREAKSVARLRHRNILTVFDYGRYDRIFYLVMEYVGGGAFKGRLGWPQDLTYAVNIVSQVGNALAYAHRRGVIHRDVKPGNILMIEEDWPLLADFGLVKVAADSLHLTASGASVGTPQYMSPEQAQGLTVDQRSDIYSLGIVLYEAVTGRPPFRADGPMAIVLKHINEPLPPPRELRSDLPEEMERVIFKALAKSPADRYQRMEEFLVDLQRAHPPFAQQMMQRRSDLLRPHKLPATPGSSSPPLIVPRLSRRRSFPWTKIIIALLLLTLILIPLALKSLMMPSASMAPLVSEVARTPGPSATPDPGPAVSTPSPSVVPATPTSQAIELRMWEADGAEMALIPAGEFTMGSEELGGDERPAHLVYLDDFWIDRYEVTNERFARFVAATGYQTEAEGQGWGWVWTGADGATDLATGWEQVEGADWRHPRGPESDVEDRMDYPVVLVSWNDADAYCRWAGKLLPTEAQWEKAARGSATGLGQERYYAWGDEYDSARANTSESGRGGAMPVGSFSPQGDSPYGVFDLTGNVWEWVADWYDGDYYGQAPSVDPPGPVSGDYKVLRGGAWSFDQAYARTAFRYNVRPDYTYDFVGFRCSSQQE